MVAVAPQDLWCEQKGTEPLHRAGPQRARAVLQPCPVCVPALTSSTANGTSPHACPAGTHLKRNSCFPPSSCSSPSPHLGDGSTALLHLGLDSRSHFGSSSLLSSPVIPPSSPCAPTKALSLGSLLLQLFSPHLYSSFPLTSTALFPPAGIV